MKFDSFEPNTKTTQFYVKWDQARIAELRRHPDMTARELAEHLGVSVDSVRSARKRFGRWGGGAEQLCVCCDTRPVWRESRAAAAMHLCKGCYIAEERRRDEERREHAAQRKYKQRTREQDV